MISWLIATNADALVLVVACFCVNAGGKFELAEVVNLLVCYLAF